MHLRGKSFRFEATYPDGRREVLLDVPRYEFEWQNVYVLAEPKLMPEGTVLRCLGQFDNSADNPTNPDPNPDGHLGRADPRRDARRLHGCRTRRSGPERWPAQGNRAGRRPVRRHLPPSSAQGYEDGLPRRQLQQDWSPVQKLDGPDKQGVFTTTLVLPAGRYEYKYVQDGKNYRHDPANWRQAGFFNNSVLTVSKGL